MDLLYWTPHPPSDRAVVWQGWRHGGTAAIADGIPVLLAAAAAAAAAAARRRAMNEAASSSDEVPSSWHCKHGGSSSCALLASVMPLAAPGHEYTMMRHAAAIATARGAAHLGFHWLTAERNEPTAAFLFRCLGGLRT